MTADLRNWKVLRLAPRTEKALASLCKANGVPHYLPLRKAERQYASRLKTVELPLFPGYLFCGAGGEDYKRMLAQQKHVLRVITPHSSVFMLRQLVAVRRALREKPDLDPRGELKAGQRVRVKTGPMRGLEGVVERVEKKTRVLLRLEFIGDGYIPATISGRDVEIIDP